MSRTTHTTKPIRGGGPGASPTASSAAPSSFRGSQPSASQEEALRVPPLHSTAAGGETSGNGGPGQTFALDLLDRRLIQGGQRIDLPLVKSFRQFLVEHARAKVGSQFVPYSFAGRELLEQTVAIIDLILGSFTGTPLKDASLAICGGAQFGKTILSLHLDLYFTCVLFRNFGYYLPDDDLVEGIVDGKMRPEVIDQIPWVAQLISLGKTVNESGKAVNRKGALLSSDGQRMALGYVRGMGKIPTSFSMDGLLEDEKDDIKDKHSKFLPGRMSAGDLRFRLSIGTQRYHGAGQNKEFDEGTQHVGIIHCLGCGRDVCPEENWPQVCRLARDVVPRADLDPQLTWEGDFKRAGKPESVASYDPQAFYYLGCPDCGCALDRKSIKAVARFPERERLHKWSIRISQLGCSAIDLIQIVADWCNNAVKDPDAMNAFHCDRLALPRSTSQAITPKTLERARAQEPYDLSLAPRAGVARYAGLDTGDRCWFLAREVESPTVKRITWLEQLSAERVRSRVPQLFETLGLSCLFVDAGPLRDLARDLCFLLNGLVNFKPPAIADPDKARISFPGGLMWDGERERWTGVKCAAVEFTLKDAQGIRHKLGKTQDGLFFPLIACNRNETIQRVVNELLTAEEGVIEVIDGKLRLAPIMHLPRRGPGAPKVLETLDSHLLVGSRKLKDDAGKEDHFVDQCENHFLLADAYSGLAERDGLARGLGGMTGVEGIRLGGGRGGVPRFKPALLGRPS